MARPPLLLATTLACVATAPALAQPPLELRSPDNRNLVRVATDEEGRATYSVLRDGQVILAPSPITLELDVGVRSTRRWKKRSTSCERCRRAGTRRGSWPGRSASGLRLRDERVATGMWA